MMFMRRVLSSIRRGMIMLLGFFIITTITNNNTFFFWKMVSVSVYHHWCNQFTNRTRSGGCFFFFFLLTNTRCCLNKCQISGSSQIFFQANSLEVCLIRLLAQSPLDSGFTILIQRPELALQNKVFATFYMHRVMLGVCFISLC